MTILERITAATQLRVERGMATQPIEMLAAQCGELPRLNFEFEEALKPSGMSFICEAKKASPSKGLISPDFPYIEIARDYEAAGAACVSVLTEPDYFLGDDLYLREIAGAIAIPTLRKDFVVGPWQIYQARLLGAKAVLLICSILSPHELRSCLETAHGLGLSALTEVHDEGELAVAISAGARLIGANNRDLHSFEVDIHNSLRLRALAPPGIIFVAESGIGCREDVELLESNGIEAVLIGETLMRSGDRQAALRTLAGTAAGAAGAAEAGKAAGAAAATGAAGAAGAATEASEAAGAGKAAGAAAATGAAEAAGAAGSAVAAGAAPWL